MRNTGYLIVDNRASGGTLVEHDTRLCRHCQTILLVPVAGQPGAYCTKCNGYVCADGPCATVCTPVARQLNEAARWAARAGVGLDRTRQAMIRQRAQGIRQQLERQHERDTFRAAMGQEGR